MIITTDFSGNVSIHRISKLGASPIPSTLKANAGIVPYKGRGRFPSQSSRKNLTYPLFGVMRGEITRPT